MGLVLGRVDGGGAMNLALKKGKRVTTGGKDRGEIGGEAPLQLSSLLLLPTVTVSLFSTRRFSLLLCPPKLEPTLSLVSP